MICPAEKDPLCKQLKKLERLYSVVDNYIFNKTNYDAELIKKVERIYNDRSPSRHRAKSIANSFPELKKELSYRPITEHHLVKKRSQIIKESIKLSHDITDEINGNKMFTPYQQWAVWIHPI